MALAHDLNWGIFAMNYEENIVIALDFDGVLNNYRGKGNDESFPKASGEPVIGAREAVIELLEQGYEVVVFSARADYPGGPAAIREWLNIWKFPELEVAEGAKVKAHLYVDDRGFRFNGPQDWTKLFKFLEANPVPPRWGKGDSECHA